MVGVYRFWLEGALGVFWALPGGLHVFDGLGNGKSMVSY